MKFLEVIRAIQRKTYRVLFRQKYEMETFESTPIRNGNDNYGKKFYVIYRSSEWEGLMSYVNNFLWFIDYAKRRGMIPVVDMKNFPNSYLEDGELGNVNAYEKFFMQPDRYSLENTENAACIVTNMGLASPCSYMDKRKYLVKKKWRILYQHSIRLNKSTEEYINNEYKKLISFDDIVLGINIRGTDYTRLKIPGLPKQPDISDIIEKAKEWFSRYKCTKVFVCCDSDETLAKVKRQWKDGVVVTNSRKYYPDKVDETGKITNPMIRFDRENDAYCKGVEYLTSVVILSKCDYILGGLSGAMLSAQLMRDPQNDFAKIYVWNKGKY